MKTILIDAWNTFVNENGVNHEMKSILDHFNNNKIIVTNANEEEKTTFGIVNMPYPVFSLEHNPNKTDPDYFKKMLDYFNLSIENVVYFEHNEAAVKSAQSIGIKTLWLQKDSDLSVLKEFLASNL
jgi:HAD superfamily hydrolase (TIGR01509 family)